MYTAMYGSRSYVLDNVSAYEVMKRAAEFLSQGAHDDARAALSLAVRVESGTADQAEIDGLLITQHAA